VGVSRALLDLENKQDKELIRAIRVGKNGEVRSKRLMLTPEGLPPRCTDRCPDSAVLVVAAEQQWPAGLQASRAQQHSGRAGQPAASLKTVLETGATAAWKIETFASASMLNTATAVTPGTGVSEKTGI